ncbi:VOC family protein [Paenibacillus solisilvae]|uniref:VOC family protein n=1 Tax=Paenibacillus solisilvae TaxID=2486751 RepID=A0ABW0VXU2_9BACL
MKLLQIRLMVKDFKKSAAFYKDLLGFTVSYYSEEQEYALFDTGETKIELLAHQAIADIVGEAGMTLDTVAPSRFLLNLSVEDVDASFTELRDKGIEFVTQPHDRPEWSARVAHFRDVDGNLLEIYRMLS